jgi:PRTRC genetic system ThiF family protein
VVGRTPRLHRTERDVLRQHSGPSHRLCRHPRSSQNDHEALTSPCQGTVYWLDIGNNAASGQYVLGQPLNGENRRKAARLRTVAELYPEIVDTDGGEGQVPSCSAVEALTRQEPFINQTLAASALAMLAQLIRYGRIAHHGVFYNAQTGKMSVLAIDPEQWSKMQRRNRLLRHAA